MFSAPDSMILHDPECQTYCCFRSFGQPMQVNNFNDLSPYPTFTTCYSDQSIFTLSNGKNQILYDDRNTSNVQVPEFREAIVVHEVTRAHSGFNYKKPIKRTRYDSFSYSTSLGEAQCKQRSTCKGILKRKRKRTIFSTEQIIVMEGVFKKRPYVSREERLFLSQQLNITEKTIKIWFQNRRRVTEKRDSNRVDSDHSDSTVEEECNDYNTRLDYIESQISHNTDEYGYVTLGTEALTELFTIIDNVLSHNCHNSLNDIKSNDSYLMYEPVSPESLSDDNKDSENISKWEPSEPEESLQRLIDIHMVL